MLGITEDKSGDYVCKVTIGNTTSTDSASISIKTTGLSLGILQLMIYSYKHEDVYSCLSSIRNDARFNVGMNEEKLKSCN